MICFLTSSHTRPGFEEINPANRLAAELRACLPQPCRALNIASDPEGWALTDFYAEITKRCFENSGFRFQRFTVLDSRNEGEAAALVRDSELLILSGGHVPTQNAFFRRIGLRSLLEGFDGVVLGISAGSMNAAELVYSQPERPGEALDPNYPKWLPGLGLTKIQLIPHYQDTKDDVLDGLRLFEDVTYADSMGHTFYVLPDGSYLFAAPGKEELRGEAYRLRNGVLEQIAENGDVVSLF